MPTNDKKGTKMNLTPLNFNPANKLQSFKGQEECLEIQCNCKENISPDAFAIKESIDKNTEALEALAEQAKINNYTMYAIEKSKSSTQGFHKDSFSKTQNPVDFVHYVNKNWKQPTYY